jgi:hypothetical protein
VDFDQVHVAILIVMLEVQYGVQILLLAAKLHIVGVDVR